MPTPHPITALIYNDSAQADALMREIAIGLLERGLRLGGLVQINTPRPARSRCDMVLEDLTSGTHIPLTQDRGPLARGCALDVSQLLSAVSAVEAALEMQPDAILINKFGKTESEGGGFRDLIATIVARGVPLLIAVPYRNLDN
jgi:nucleoside-triphosphatase THEP1